MERGKEAEEPKAKLPLIFAMQELRRFQYRGTGREVCFERGGREKREDGDLQKGAGGAGYVCQSRSVAAGWEGLDLGSTTMYLSCIY